MAIFFPPSSRGTAPASNWRARLPARTTNSNLFSLGALSTMSFQADLQVRRYVHVTTRRRASGPPSFKRRDDVFGRLPHHLDAGALGQHDRAEPFHGRFHFVVHDAALVGRYLAVLAT